MSKTLTLKDIIMIVVGSAMFALGVNLFVVPLGLYNGGFLGISQLIRTAILHYTNLNVGFDIAGVINMIINIPLFILAYTSISRKFLWGTVLSIAVQTITMTFVPIPTTPILTDIVASCLTGAVIGGIGVGLTLQTGCSGGGVDIIGMYAAMKWKDFSVGKVGLILNVCIYTICAICFELPTAIYSIIYAAAYSYVMDKMHLQNIETNVMIFTKDPHIREMILNDFHRGVTYWHGAGAYTESDTEVLVTIVSKYEVEKLTKAIHEADPKSFIIVHEGSKVTGGYEKRLV